MAVKTSWAAGDVLLAADLTDTFAAKAPTASPTFTGNVVWSGAVLRTATANVATSQSIISTSYTDLATAGPAVTLTTGTKALVIISANLTNSTTGTYAYMGFAVSGATTIAASDANALIYRVPTANYDLVASRAVLLTGLTAGSNTFTAKYMSGSGAYTAIFFNRYIHVIDLGS